MAGAPPPPGWHPDPLGRFEFRYWDGANWTEHVSTAGITQTSPPDLPPGPPAAGMLVARPAVGPDEITSDDKTWAVLSHLLGWVLALVALLVKGNERPFVRDQAVEALNFDITLLIAMIVSFVLIFVVIGIFLIFVVAIGGLVLHIVAAVQSGKGVRYRYPINLRIIK